MTYSKSEKDLIVINPTEVSKSLKGQGVGLSLVKKAVKYIREKSQKMISLCFYAKSVFDKKNDIKDVLYS